LRSRNEEGCSEHFRNHCNETEAAA
jgi:hypothetical protein